jgi:hypothetical protein
LQAGPYAVTREHLSGIHERCAWVYLGNVHLFALSLCTLLICTTHAKQLKISIRGAALSKQTTCYGTDY